MEANGIEQVEATMSEGKWDSIEEWADANGWTLEQALDAGVSQDEDGTIHAPESW